MVRRTTIELDQDLLARAKRVLGAATARAAVEEALRRVVAGSDSEELARAEAQRSFFAELPSWADMEVMAGEEMWR